MRIIQGHDLANLHEQLVPHIVKNCYKKPNGTPEVYPGENGQDTIECPEVTLFCRTPLYGRRFVHPPEAPFDQRFMDEYARQLIHGKTGTGFFEYDYHSRLCAWGQEWMSCDGSVYDDQIMYILNKLRSSPVSRRAMAITWYPQIDTEKDDVPCLQLIHLTIREGKLHMKVVFRSEDMMLGIGPNMYGLTSLQCYISNCLDVDVGTYTHVAFCPHLYIHRDADYLKAFNKSWWESCGLKI
jgi:thymidylate synthase